MYGQVVKWFQNHSYMDKKSVCAPRKPPPSMPENSDSDDEDAVQSHLSELVKELKKKNYDNGL